MEPLNPLKRTRLLRSMNIAELARISGVSRQTIYNLESDKTRGNMETWRKLADALEVPVDEIAGRRIDPLAEPAPALN